MHIHTHDCIKNSCVLLSTKEYYTQIAQITVNCNYTCICIIHINHLSDQSNNQQIKNNIITGPDAILCLMSKT